MSGGSRGTGGPAPPHPPLSSRGTGTWAVPGESPSQRKGGSAVRDARESACWAPGRPPALTPHTLLSANLSPVRHSTQVLPSFPDMTSKQPRGSLEVLAAGSLASVARAPAPCLPHDPSPGLGHPLRWLQDHLPSSLLPSSEPAAYGFSPISPVSTSSRFSRLQMAQWEPADSSSRAACSAHWGSLRAAWERHLLSIQCMIHLHYACTCIVSHTLTLTYCYAGKTPFNETRRQITNQTNGTQH